MTYESVCECIEVDPREPIVARADGGGDHACITSGDAVELSSNSVPEVVASAPSSLPFRTS